MQSIPVKMSTDRTSTLRKIVVILVALSTLGPRIAEAQQKDQYNYHQSTGMLITMGTQALMICNGLFVSNRTLDQIYEQELEIYRMPVLPPSMVEIDRERRTVAVGVGGNSPIPTMRAVYREGLGAVLLGPDQTFEDIDDFPVLDLPPLPGDSTKIPWPDGDLVQEKPLGESVSGDALEAAGDWAFDRVGHGGAVSEDTLSL